MTLQDALVAYKTYARAEGKSPKTVVWVVSSVGYFAEFLGLGQQDIDTITGNDLRRFIIALQSKPKFASHPYNKPQKAKLRDRVELRFQVPKGRVANIMGVMNLLQSKFESLEIELTASDGEITEQDYADMVLDIRAAVAYNSRKGLPWSS